MDESLAVRAFAAIRADRIREVEAARQPRRNVLGDCPACRRPLESGQEITAVDGRLRHDGCGRPRTWAMPAEPPADVAKLKDRNEREWVLGQPMQPAQSTDPAWWHGRQCASFEWLLFNAGPLTEVVDDQ